MLVQKVRKFQKTENTQASLLSMVYVSMTSRIHVVLPIHLRLCTHSLTPHTHTNTHTHTHTHTHARTVSLLWRDPGTEKAQLTRELLLTIRSLSNGKVDYRYTHSVYTTHVTHTHTPPPGTYSPAVLNWHGLSVKLRPSHTKPHTPNNPAP